VTDPSPTPGSEGSDAGVDVPPGEAVAGPATESATDPASQSAALVPPAATILVADEPATADALDRAGPSPDAADSMTSSAAKTSPRGKKGSGRVFLEWIVLIVVALGIAFLIKSFLFQAFYIPSESMTPTLQVGDRVLVNKLSYDLHEVNRGDIIVFEAPAAARSEGIDDLVKRAIGLPGDTVTGDDAGGVVVNGRRLSEPYLPKGTQSRFTDVPPGCDPPPGGAPGCVVPEGRLFMMGDNREASKDSRVFGPINENTIVGRVFVRIWPLSDLGLL